MIKKTILITLIFVFVMSAYSYGATYNIKGYTYVSLEPLCRKYGIGLDWDSFGRIVTLKKNGIEARLRIDSDKILIGDSFKDIGPSVKFHKGEVVIPKSFYRRGFLDIFNSSYTSTKQPAALSKPEAHHLIKSIVLDAGHGGKDPGAVGRYGLKEKTVVLDITKRLKRILAGRGIKVSMTRASDEFIPLWKRAQIANDKKCDLFVSIHANASRSRRVRGFEVYYLSDGTTTGDVARATEAAENRVVEFEEGSIDKYNAYTNAIACDLMFEEYRRQSRDLAKYICTSVKRQNYIRDRGVKKAGFHVLKNTQMPAILVEVGFISNKREEALLKDSSHRQKVAEAIATGILSYKKEYERTNGFAI